MSERSEKHPGLYRDCLKCGNPVHNHSKACKLCGEASPWTVEGVATTQKPVADAPNAPGAVTPPHATQSVPAAIIGGFGKSTAEGIEIVKDGAVIKQTIAPFEPHVVMKDFNHQFGDVLGVFKAGQVISDFQTVTKLKLAGQPITPASEVDGLACCPKCNEMFIPRKIGGDKPKVA
jgi:hypothetical protein